MVRILMKLALALALTAGLTAPTAQTARAQYVRTYTVYVWKASCGEWVPVCKTTSYAYACKKAQYYSDCGYKACVR